MKNSRNAVIILICCLLSSFPARAQFFKDNPFYQKNTPAAATTNNLIKMKIPDDISLEASMNRFPSKQNYIFFRADLDGDQKPDTVDFKIFGKEREMFELRINNTSLKKFIDSDDITLRVIDFNPEDGVKEIMLELKSPIETRNSHKYYFLKYQNHRLSYIGIFTGCDGANFADNHLQILTDMRWWVRKEKYRLNPAHLLNRVKDEYINVDVDLRLKKRLPVLKKKQLNTPIHYIPAGNTISVLFYAVEDGKEWYIIQYHESMIGFTTASVLEDCAGLKDL